MRVDTWPSEWALLVLVLGLACATQPGAPTDRIEFHLPFGTDADGRDPAWLGYALARIAGPPESSMAHPSPDPAPFREELYARESMALIWGELVEKDGYSDAYLEDLVRIQSAGFLDEYVWLCLPTVRGSAPPDLQLADFREWLRSELPNHAVESWSPALMEGQQVVLHVGAQGHPQTARSCTVQ